MPNDPVVITSDYTMLVPWFMAALNNLLLMSTILFEYDTDEFSECGRKSLGTLAFVQFAVWFVALPCWVGTPRVSYKYFKLYDVLLRFDYCFFIVWGFVFAILSGDCMYTRTDFFFLLNNIIGLVSFYKHFRQVEERNGYYEPLPLIPQVYL